MDFGGAGTVGDLESLHAMDDGRGLLMPILDIELEPAELGC